MRLQTLTFPKAGICFEPEMFYRLVTIAGHETSPYHFDAQAQRLQIDRGGVVFFDTYYNGISVGKWMKYTHAQSFSLVLELKGAFIVTLLHSKYINGAVVQKSVAAREVQAPEQETVRIDFPPCEPVGALSFKLESLEDGGTLYSGWYASQEESLPTRPVELAINICNYKREAYIYRNMGIVRRYILDDPDCELREHLHIFIADNSSSVDLDKLPKGISRVYPQGDFGGAGGFTRGLMEVLRSREELSLTHIVMMDDDVLLEPESLKRLYAFERLLKDEYHGAFVNGALLRLDFQNIQYTNGGEWDMKKCYVFHRIGANLCTLRDVLINEIEDGTKLGAWWFHCIPLDQVSLENLPYPFFFHMDDVEYDLRNCKRVITMNGIGVWHEPFEYKPGSQLMYYNTRNVLIAHMIHFPEMTKRDAVDFLNQFFVHIWYYRYKDAMLMLRGFEDALRGTKWLVGQNPEQLLEDVLSEGYKKQPLDQLPMRLDYEKYLQSHRGEPAEGKWRRRFRKLTLNGYLLPANHDAVIPMFGLLIRTTYRARNVLNYDPISDRAYVTKKSYRELFRVLKRYFKVKRQLKRQFEAVRADYKENFSSVTNETFWRGYLGIAGEEGK